MNFTNLPYRIRSKIQPIDGCWNWQAALNESGYGMIWWNGRMRRAHRVVYELLVGEIPNETLDHICRNRRCVNPSHLDPVSLAENKQRGNSPAAIHARKTHCPQGHPYDQTNTVIGKRGDGRKYRQCKICRNQHAKRYYKMRIK